MKAALAAAVLLFAVPAAAAPGDPRALRGTLEWPAALSAEPFIVVRAEDGRLYYADVARAQRTSAGSISGRISLVGVEGVQPHEVSAVAVGAGDSALAVLSPTLPTPAEVAPPSSLPRQAMTPPPAAMPAPPAAAVPPAPGAPGSPAATAAPPGPATSEDLWMVQGRVVSVTPRELVVRTSGAETMRVDVTKLSPWTRDSVRAGDQVKLFGVPQRDRRLVANGFIQEAPAAPAAAPATR
jgi:hypothetical protein